MDRRPGHGEGSGRRQHGCGGNAQQASAADAATAVINIQPKIEAINPLETSQGSTLLATTVALTSPNRYS